MVSGIYDTRMHGNLAVTLVNIVNYKVIYFIRAPFADYYVTKKSERRYDIEGAWDERFIDEATTFEEVLQIINELQEGLMPW